MAAVAGTGTLKAMSAASLMALTWAKVPIPKTSPAARPTGQSAEELRQITIKGKSREVPIALRPGDMPNIFVEAVTLSDAEVVTETKQIVLPPVKRVLSVEVLPKKLDEEVAQLMVEGFGGVLTQLTPTQADYIGVETEGPFKPESYKY